MSNHNDQDYPFNVREYHALHRVSKILRKHNDFHVDLKQVLKTLHNDMGMERGMISLVNREKDEIQAEVSLGIDRRHKEVRYLMGEGITGKVVAEGRPILVPNIDDEPVFLDRSEQRKGLDQSNIAFLCVPIKYRDEIVGTLSVDKSSGEKSNDLYQELNFLTEISDMIASRVRRRQVEQDVSRLKHLEETKLSNHIIGNSGAMRELARQIKQVADSNTTVMVTGETGTGKELIAREIHERSPRKHAPLIRVNCGAIPENLIESELFGHEKGAFTGAIQQRIGRFEMAHGGTIFLDEIGEIPANAQVKLLRVLQERELERIGGSETIKVNVRVIAATNRTLDQDISDGRFRSDLFYRLNVFPIHIPTLRERGADIMLLADYFVQKYSKELNKQVERIDTATIDMLMAYHWPGNVRELENIIERAVLLSEEGTIHGHHLPPSLQLHVPDQKEKKINGRFETLVSNYERQLIIEALKDSWGNQSEAARQLGTTKRVIQYKVQKLGIDYRRFSRPSHTRVL